MAITGKFIADFSSFQAAVQQAELSLRSFEQGAAKVETSLTRVTNSLSGTKLIQDATVMAEAVDRVGGVSKLTQAELARVGATAAEAVAKMKALGMDVPERLERLASSAQSATPAIRSMTGAAGEASNAFGSFRQGLSSADRTLAAFGIQIGPEIKAIEELGSAAGKTASQLGMIGTIGLSAAAAIAGWKFGRLVADFFDLDDSIGDATASLLGFGDVAGERTAARLDVLSRATDIARRAITDYAEAQRIILAENARIAESFNNSTTRVRDWGNEIAAVRNSGNIQALRADLQSQNSTLQELSAQYHISVRALEFFQRAMKDSSTAQKQWADEARAKYAQLKEAQEELNNAGDGWRKTLAAIAPETVKVIEGYVAMGAPLSAIATALGVTANQVKAVSNAWKEQLAEMGRIDAKLVDTSKNFIETLIRNGAGYVAESQKQLQQYAAMFQLAKQLEAEIRPGPSKTPGMQLEEDTAGLEGMRGIWSDSQVNDYLNMLYERFYRREGEAGRMPGTSYAPPALLNSPSGALGPTAAPTTINNNTINMNGILATSDPSGKAALRSAVDEALMAGARMNRKFEGA